MQLNLKSQATLNHDYLATLYTEQMSIGARIRQLRVESKLSGEKFGDLCGVSKGMVSQWESDTSTPPTDRLVELKKHLNFSFDWLIGGDEVDRKIMAVHAAMQSMPEYKKDMIVQASNSLAEQPKPNHNNGTQ